jgi:hypothetical protein
VQSAAAKLRFCDPGVVRSAVGGYGRQRRQGVSRSHCGGSTEGSKRRRWGNVLAQSGPQSSATRSLPASTCPGGQIELSSKTCTCTARRSRGAYYLGHTWGRRGRMGDLHNNMYVLGAWWGGASHPNYRAHPLTHAQDKPTKPDTGLEKQLARRFVTQNYQLAVSSSHWRYKLAGPTPTTSGNSNSCSMLHSRTALDSSCGLLVVRELLQ